MMNNYFKYWGKIANANDCQTYHLLAYHSLNVAAVSRQLTEQLHISRHLARQLNIPEATVTEWIAFLGMLHDLGKFIDAVNAERVADAWNRLKHNVYSRNLKQEILGLPEA